MKNSQKGIGNPLLIAIVGIVIVVILFGGYKVMTGSQTSPTPTPQATPTTEAVQPTQMQEASTQEKATESAAGDSTTSAVKTFEISAVPFSFTPNVIKVKKGDTVKIVFTNKQGFHDLVVDKYNVATKQIGVGKTDEITFKADKAGSFEYYCSVGNHRAMGLKGTLIVE